ARQVAASHPPTGTLSHPIIVLGPATASRTPSGPATHRPAWRLHPSEPSQLPSALSETYAGSAEAGCSSGTHRPTSSSAAGGTSAGGSGSAGANASRTSSVTSGGCASDGARSGPAVGSPPGSSRAVTAPPASRSTRSSPATSNDTARASHCGVDAATSRHSPVACERYATNRPPWSARQVPPATPHSRHTHRSSGPSRTIRSPGSPVSVRRQVPIRSTGSTSSAPDPVGADPAWSGQPGAPSAGADLSGPVNAAANSTAATTAATILPRIPTSLLTSRGPVTG